jgi:hypothetical protein
MRRREAKIKIYWEKSVLEKEKDALRCYKQVFSDKIESYKAIYFGMEGV